MALEGQDRSFEEKQGQRKNRETKECYFKVVLSQSKKLNPPTKVKDGRNER